MNKGDFKFGLAGALFGTGIEEKLSNASAIVYEQVVSLSSFRPDATVENAVLFFGTGISTSGSKLSQLSAGAKVESMQLRLPDCETAASVNLTNASTALQVKFEQKFRVGAFSWQTCGTQTDPVFTDGGSEEDVQLEFASYIRPQWSSAGQVKATDFAYDMLHFCDQKPAQCFRIKYIFPLSTDGLGGVTNMATPLNNGPMTGKYFAYDPEVTIVNVDGTSTPASGSALVSGAACAGVRYLQLFLLLSVAACML